MFLKYFDVTNVFSAFFFCREIVYLIRSGNCIIRNKSSLETKDFAFVKK